jgi:glutaconyl-CoA/methylmalonyl-CoA decarboxylase subunit gamma
MKLNVKVNNLSYEVEIKDLNARPVIAVVGGETFEVWPEKEARPAAVETPATVPTAAPAPAAAAAASAPRPAATGSVDRTKLVMAPIPGVIVTINVKVGDVVAAGKELCVLEAMKMKNSIRASRAGTIAAIRVAVSEQVKNGQVLMEYGD